MKSLLAALWLNQNQVRAQSAPEQLAEPVRKNALAQNGKAIATATRWRTRDDIIPLDVEDLNTLQEL
ncbi:MAG: hypothetical protein HOA27_02980 [Gemmatimonadetes bacterium]|nr:hypothetical protein [Gemmatimonadota bacterium]MBT7551265.1 hypothetical protein [Gemmatimonadota bacterium]